MEQICEFTSLDILYCFNYASQSVFIKLIEASYRSYGDLQLRQMLLVVSPSRMQMASFQSFNCLSGQQRILTYIFDKRFLKGSVYYL